MVKHAHASGSPGIDSANSLVSGDVRRHNLGLIAEYLVAQGPSSRSQIADGTGLTRGAVTALTKLLVDARVLRESEPATGGGKGRPMTFLELAADDVAVLALQLDADQAIAMVASLSGEVLFRIAEHHGRPMGDPEPVLDVLAGVLNRALDVAAGAGRRIVELTVVVFAPVAEDPAVVLGDSDLGWGVVDVLGGLRNRVSGMPENTTLRSDAEFAALAEFDRLDGVRDMLYLKSNSGIGGAIIIDGKILRGAHGFAGAFGHLPIDHDGTNCVCGRRGCFVLVAGPDVVLAAAGLAAELEAEGLTSALAELTRRILNGDERATAAFEDAARWIARTLHVLTTTLDPQVVVLGGYWAQLAGQVRKAFDDASPVIEGDSAYGPEIVPGRLGDDATLLGAVWESRNRLLRDPLGVSLI